MLNPGLLILTKYLRWLLFLMFQCIRFVMMSTFEANRPCLANFIKLIWHNDFADQRLQDKSIIAIVKTDTTGKSICPIEMPISSAKSAIRIERDLGLK